MGWRATSEHFLNSLTKWLTRNKLWAEKKKKRMGKVPWASISIKMKNVVKGRVYPEHYSKKAGEKGDRDHLQLVHTICFSIQPCLCGGWAGEPGQSRLHLLSAQAPHGLLASITSLCKLEDYQSSGIIQSKLKQRWWLLHAPIPPTETDEHGAVMNSDFPVPRNGPEPLMWLLPFSTISLKRYGPCRFW